MHLNVGIVSCQRLLDSRWFTYSVRLAGLVDGWRLCEDTPSRTWSFSQPNEMPYEQKEDG